MRIRGLDSIRGIAAVMVVLFHLALMVLSPQAIQHTLKYSLFVALFLNGQFAVTLFYILSGFVLTYALTKEGDYRFLHFMQKRVVRLYIPYASALAIAFALFFIWRSTNLPHVPHMVWDLPAHPLNYLSLILMGGMQGQGSIDSPIWTICVEMQAALFMPFLVRVDKSKLPFFVIALIVAGQLFAYIEMPWGAENFRNPIGAVGRLAATLYYFQFFGMGSLIFQWREEIANFLAGCSRIVIATMAAVSVVCLGMCAFTTSEQIGTSLDAIAACFIICTCVSLPAINQSLAKAPLLFFGKISFSLYLTHVPIMQFVGSLAAPIVGATPAMISSLIPVIAIAYLFNRYVEQPAADLSHSLSRRTHPKPAAKKSAA